MVINSNWANRTCFLLLILLVTARLSSTAQVSFQAIAPQSVALNEQFQIKFTIQNGTGTDFHAPSFDGLNVMFPPANAISKMNINGKESMTYTGTFMGQRTGKITVGKATVKVKGRTYSTNPITINILPADSKAGNVPSEQTKGLASNDVFIRAIASPTSVFEQQPLLITYKLYTRTNRMEFEDVKFPQYDGFIEETLPLQQPIQLQMEHYNGKNYYTAILKQALIFPQRVGKLIVPKGRFDVRIAVENEINSIDDFFDFSTPTLVSRTLTSPEITIEAKPLPQPQPENFQNAVGQYSIKLIPPQEKNLKSNDIVTLKLIIEGKGNTKLITAPHIAFPESFEVYDPKQQSQQQTSAGGMEGQKTFEYNVIPRNAGHFTIPPITLSFFNPTTKQYQTASTQPLELKIQKGANEGATLKTDIELLGNDIAYLKDYHPSPRASIKRFIATPLLFALPYAIIIVLAICGGVVYYKHRKAQQDVIKMRQKKASKIIRKHFQAIEQLAQNGKVSEFYQALPKAVYTYLSDKFAIPTHKLNRSAISSELEALGANSQISSQLFEILDKADEAAFSNRMSNTSPQELLQSTMEIITKLDNLKKIK